MAEGKRYFWLKLYDDFFGSMRIKKLRKMAGGDTFLIIYLKMQLKAMKNNGVIRWTGVEENVVEELALDLDEEPDNVRITLAYLLACGLAETDDQVSFFFPYAVANVGSEGSSAKRVREYRDRKALQSNAPVTPVKQIGNGEKEIESELESEEESETDTEEETENNNSSFLSEQKIDSRELRKRAYAESDLPDSFDYKIRRAFSGRPCPMCGFKMLNVEKGPHRPTIQHNYPISKGGKHELSNISVICYSCNMSNQAKPTRALNNAEVVEEWKRIIEKETPAPSGYPNREAQIKYWRDRVDLFKRQGFDTEGVYDLAEANGITREEIDSYTEDAP